VAEALRVLFAPYFPDNPYQRELQAALRARGVEIANATLDSDELPFRRRFRMSRPHIVHLHWAEKYIVDRSLPKALFKTFRFLRDLRYLVAEGSKVVWTVHNALNHEAQHVALEAYARRHVVPHVAAFIVHGESGRDVVLRDFGAPRDARIHVVPHASYVGVYRDDVDRAAAREALALEPDAFVFLLFGRILAYKGADALVAALAQSAVLAAARDVRVVIAGECTDRELAASLGAAAKADPRIRLDLTYIPDDRIQLYQRAADVAVLPYRRILASGAALLATSFGRPIVAPRLGDLEESVTEDGGFLYDPADPAGLAGALELALASRDRLEAIGRRNRERAEAWRFDDAAAATLEVYASVREDVFSADAAERKRLKLERLREAARRSPPAAGSDV
jgi:beta-1,4-mannosyltransferase